MPKTARIILIAVCALLVILSLALLSKFRRIIRDSGDLSVEEIRKQCSLLLILLTIVIIMLIVISIYIALIYRIH